MKTQPGIIETILRDRTAKAYIACALWSSTDDNGNPLDARHSIEDFDIDTLEDCFADCKEFCTRAADAIDYLDLSPESIGHDLWLTRNRHGAGFWDRGYPDGMGEYLTKIAHSMGEYDLAVGDDGRIYGIG